MATATAARPSASAPGKVVGSGVDVTVRGYLKEVQYKETGRYPSATILVSCGRKRGDHITPSYMRCVLQGRYLDAFKKVALETGAFLILHGYLRTYRFEGGDGGKSRYFERVIVTHFGYAAPPVEDGSPS